MLIARGNTESIVVASTSRIRSVIVRVAARPADEAAFVHRTRRMGSAAPDPAINTEVAEIPRSLIDRVVLSPARDARDGLAAELHGDLAMILAVCNPGNGGKRKLPAVGTASGVKRA